jgi:hypothetical protein
LKRHENLYHNPNYVAAVPKEKTHFCPTCKKAFRHKGNLMRHMLQHEGRTSEVEENRMIKGEPNSEDINGGGSNYVVVEVINEEVEYDEGDYDLDAEEMVEVDGTETFKLSEDDAFVTGLEFEGGDEN